MGSSLGGRDWGVISAPAAGEVGSLLFSMSLSMKAPMSLHAAPTNHTSFTSTPHAWAEAAHLWWPLAL